MFGMEDELREEIESLKKELSKYKKIAEEYEQKKTELRLAEGRAKQAELVARYEADREAEKKFAEKLARQNEEYGDRYTDYFGKRLTAYAVIRIQDYIKPKCSKCDANRRIHFTPPSGKSMSELCDCAVKGYVFKVKPVILHKIESTNLQGWFGELNKAVSNFLYYKYKEFDYHNTTELELCSEDVYDEVEDVSEIPPKKSIVFVNREDAEKYCDIMNSRDLSESDWED